MACMPPLHTIVLMSYEWFGSLPEFLRKDILGRAKERRLRSGERLYARGQASDGMYGVVEGSVRVMGISSRGRETLLDFYGPGTWFGDVSLLDGLPRSHDADAHGEATVLHVSSRDIEDLLSRHPDFGRALLRLQALRVRLMLMALEQYSAQSLEQRLASRLLMLSGPYGNLNSEGVAIDLHLPQEILAQLIGSTRQRVNQILKSWESRKIITQNYGCILLLDQAKLQRLAES